MRDIINATIGENHFLKCSTYSIARNGEGLTPCLSISIPDGLKTFWAYIDFKKPNGETVKTPRIDYTEGKIVYNIPSAVLDAEGELEVQVVFQNETGEVWKTYVKEFAVRYSINATDDISNKEDFITEVQKLVDEAVEVAKSVEERANNGEFNGKDALTDQTYNPTSKNAQSGIAVAEALKGSTDWITIVDLTLDKKGGDTKSVEVQLSGVSMDNLKNCQELICFIEFTPIYNYNSNTVRLQASMETDNGEMLLLYASNLQLTANRKARALSQITVNDFCSVINNTPIMQDLIASASKNITAFSMYNLKDINVYEFATHINFELLFSSSQKDTQSFGAGARFKLIGRVS